MSAKKRQKVLLSSVQNIEINERIALKSLSNDSIPTFGTDKASFSDDFEAFFEVVNKLCQATVPERYPYKEAKLVHHDYDLSKRWYVDFSAWDISQEKLVRRRLFEPINRKKSVGERLQVGNYIVHVVNNELQQGKVFGRDTIITDQINFNINKMKVAEALLYVASEKKLTGHRKTYYRGFHALVTNWNDWLEFDQRDDFLIKNLKHSDLFTFFNYVNRVKSLSNKTYNNYRNYFSTAINFLLKREPKLFKVSPTASIDTLPVIARKHAAFTTTQIEKIRNRCIASGQNQLLLFIQFLYNTLARPNELIQLRLTHIDLELQRIFIPGEVSKTKFDEYVGVSDHLKEVIEVSGIMNYPPDYFIFGNKGVPGPNRYLTGNPMWSRNQKILKDTGLYAFNENFSLYSYKHSGAISLYVATKDIKLVQRQCRHKTLNQTSEYLRDLGMVSGLEGLAHWKGAV